ncbi:MAG: UDP-2,3-diacylglucosamine diphosphatase [Gammaproteobacteria bacterium]
MTTWFISDIHLDSERPDIASAFAHFVDTTARAADALYILGDWFESWIGDDDPDPAKHAAIAAVKQLSERGTQCYFCHGNRDFLAGAKLANDAGVTLLDEEHVVELGGERVLLMHGDSLCTDDVQYMAFRQQARDPAWQSQVLALPIPARQALAAQAREQSATDMAQKTEDIMDVNAQAVLDTLQRHDVRRLIHGHTHRPATHRIDDNGVERTRHVLGDWYEQGRVLVHDTNGFREVEIPLADRCGS